MFMSTQVYENIDPIFDELGVIKCPYFYCIEA